MINNENILQRGALIMLIVALISSWGAWMPSEVVALRLNAFDFAEWSSVMWQVSGGKLHAMPDVLRGALVLCSIALALKAGDVRSLWGRWLIRGIALLPVLVVVPQYPFWFQEENRGRFVIAVMGLIGVGLSVFADRRARVRHGMVAGIALSAVTLAIWAFISLGVPLAVYYGGSLQVGWGLNVFVVMLIGAAVIEGFQLLRPSQPEAAAEMAAG